MIKVNGLPVDVKKFTDGSLNVTLHSDTINNILAEKDEDVVYTAHIKSSDDLLALVLSKAAVESEIYDATSVLELPYVPYMRADRIMGEGQCGGLKAIAPIINSLGFSNVIVDDPHSDVTEALIKNVCLNTQCDIVSHLAETFLDLLDVDYLVSPDAGALKKVLKSSEKFKIPLVEAGKIRELHTNKILKSTVYTNLDLTGKRVLILDDICEYGTTHRELAKVLKKDFGVAEVKLYATHGVLPLNLRLETPSRYNFLLDYIDSVYLYNWWSDDTEESVPEQVNFLNIF